MRVIVIIAIFIVNTTLWVTSTCAQMVFDPPSTETSSEDEGASKSQPRFPTMSLQPQYQGEETKGVEYLKIPEQELARVKIEAGRLLDQSGIPVNPRQAPEGYLPLPSFPEQPAPDLNAEKGFVIYVMDEEGRFFVSLKAAPHRFHHSSLLAGRPVAAAGEMIVFNGVIFGLNNRSGHYRPPPIVLERVVSVLTRAGVSLDKALISRYGSDF